MLTGVTKERVRLRICLPRSLTLSSVSRAEVMQAIPLSMITASLPFTFFHLACFTSIPPASSAMVWLSIYLIWFRKLSRWWSGACQSPGFWFRTGPRFSCRTMCCLTPTRKRVWPESPLVPPNQVSLPFIRINMPKLVSRSASSLTRSC